MKRGERSETTLEERPAFDLYPKFSKGSLFDNIWTWSYLNWSYLNLIIFELNHIWMRSYLNNNIWMRSYLNNHIWMQSYLNNHIWKKMKKKKNEKEKEMKKKKKGRSRAALILVTRGPVQSSFKRNYAKFFPIMH